MFTLSEYHCRTQTCILSVVALNGIFMTGSLGVECFHRNCLVLLITLFVSRYIYTREKSKGVVCENGFGGSVNIVIDGRENRANIL